MQLSWLILFVWFVTTAALAQRSKNPCVYEYLTRKDNLEQTLMRYQAIYDFRRNEVVASVGAGSGSKEVIYSMMADSITFYLQDINPTCLTPENLTNTVSRLYDAGGRICTAKFIPVIGTERETQLPQQFFDKIIIENTLHELTHPNDLLTSVRTNLKPDGYLFIEDLVAKRPGQKHRGCGKLLYTEDALVELLNTNGFRLLTVTVVSPRIAADKVYKFALRTN
ncbi:hypothetical protein GCM10027423_03120 [Spirosoma arcticum]